MAASSPYSRRSFAGGAIATTIPTGMGSADSSFTLLSNTGWTFANNFFVVVDRGLATEEKIECTSINGLVVSVAARGADGTSAVAHGAGCTVQVCHVARDDDESNQVVNNVLGQSGASKGDLLYMSSAAGPNTLARLGIGANGTQWLGAAAGVPAWGIAPLTTTGDIPYASSGSAAARLAIGSANQVLMSSGTAPEWETPGYGITAATPFAVGLTTMTNYYSGTGTVSSTPSDLASVTLGAGTWLIIGSMSFLGAGSSTAQSVDLFLGPTATSATNAYAVSTQIMDQSLAVATGVGMTVTTVQTLGVSTTVYLEAVVSASTITPQKAGIVETTITNCTGIVAVRLA